MRQEVRSGVLISNGTYRLASPVWFSAFSSDYETLLPNTIDGSGGGLARFDDVRDALGVRPVVSIPTSKIGINGDTVTILNK